MNIHVRDMDPEHDTPSYCALLCRVSLKNMKQCQEWYVVCEFGMPLVILTYFFPSSRGHTIFDNRQLEIQTSCTRNNNMSNDPNGVNMNTETLNSWLRRVNTIFYLENMAGSLAYKR